VCFVWLSPEFVTNDTTVSIIFLYKNESQTYRHRLPMSVWCSLIYIGTLDSQGNNKVLLILLKLVNKDTEPFFSGERFSLRWQICSMIFAFQIVEV